MMLSKKNISVVLFGIFMYIFIPAFIVFSVGISPYYPYTKLVWNENPESEEVEKYRIYYGEEPGIYPNFVDIVGKENTECMLENFSLTEGIKYYFAMTAFNSIGESEHSDEVEYIKQLHCVIVRMDGSQKMVVH